MCLFSNSLPDASVSPSRSRGPIRLVWSLGFLVLATFATGCATRDLAFRDDAPWNSPTRETERRPRDMVIGRGPMIGFPNGAISVGDETILGRPTTHN